MIFSQFHLLLYIYIYIYYRSDVAWFNSGVNPSMSQCCVIFFLFLFGNQAILGTAFYFILFYFISLYIKGGKQVKHLIGFCLLRQNGIYELFKVESKGAIPPPPSPWLCPYVWERDRKNRNFNFLIIKIVITHQYILLLYIKLSTLILYAYTST